MPPILDCARGPEPTTFQADGGHPYWRTQPIHAEAKEVIGM